MRQLSCLQQEHFVGTRNGRKFMGDDERRFAPGKPMERRIDVGFGSGIQTSNRFIQNQDRRVTHNGASQIEASLLASGEIVTTFVHHGVVPFRHLHDKIVGFREFGSLNNLFLHGARGAKSDVLTYGLAE